MTTCRYCLTTLAISFIHHVTGQLTLLLHDPVQSCRLPFGMAAFHYYLTTLAIRIIGRVT